MDAYIYVHNYVYAKWRQVTMANGKYFGSGRRGYYIHNLALSHWYGVEIYVIEAVWCFSILDDYIFPFWAMQYVEW